MAKKAKAKRTSGKAASRKTAVKKAARKKAVTKKTAPRKKALKKKAAKKKALKKKSAVKAVKKKTASRKAPISTTKKQTPAVEPGPPPRIIPPVEEPAANEEAIGTVTHYYSHLGVTVVQINKGSLRVGDTIRFKGHTTDFTQIVESMEYEHRHVDEAPAGESVGIRVKDHTREHDILYRIR